MKIMHSDVDQASLSVIPNKALDKQDRVFYARKQHRICLLPKVNWSIWLAFNGIVLTIWAHYWFAAMIGLALLPLGFSYLAWRKRVLFVTQNGLWQSGWRRCKLLTDSVSPHAVTDPLFEWAGIYVGYLEVDGRPVTPPVPEPFVLQRRLAEARKFQSNQESQPWRY